MAAPSSSSSSEYSSSFSDEELASLDSSDDGHSEVMRVGVQGRTSEAGSSSHREQLHYSRKEKGKAIITGATDFDEISGVGTASIECGCCYCYFQIENTVHCPKEHRFCCKCVRRRVEGIIYGGLTAHASLRCMSTDYCQESIPLSEIRRALPNHVFEKYEYRQAQEAIRKANLEGLVYCPFCNIPYEVDKCRRVLDCPNPKCLKASCIQCKKPSHIPLRCEEVENLNDSDARRQVEERMTKAVIRKCNFCQAKVIKTDGCNSVTCVCGNILCYMCGQTLPHGPTNHFCSCFYRPAEAKFCKICNKCSLMQNEVEDNEALAAKAEALKELADKEPKLLDIEIGPPFKKLRREASKEKGHRIQHRLPQRWPPGLQLREIHITTMHFQPLRPVQHLPERFPANLRLQAQHPPLQLGPRFPAGMHVPHYDQLENMHLQLQHPPQHLPQRPPARHAPENLPHLANIQLQAQRPPQHLGSGFPANRQLLHDDHQLATMHLQPQRLPLRRGPAQNFPHLANMQLLPQRPPQHLGLRFPANTQLLHDDHLANIQLQPQQLPQRFPANMQLLHDDQLANMQLQPQQLPQRFPANMQLQHPDQVANRHFQTQRPRQQLPRRFPAQKDNGR